MKFIHFYITETIKLITNETLIHKSKKKFVLYYFQPVPYYCGVCKKDGHTKDRCADAMIYRLKPLDPPNPKVFTILNILCQNVYGKKN